MKRLVLPAFLSLLLLTIISFAQREHGVRPTSTGGPLMVEQAVFDVQSYELSFNVFPPKDGSTAGTISGGTTMVARAVVPTNVVVLDLDTPYNIEHVTDGKNELKYERRGGQIWIWFPMTKQVGEEIRTYVRYGGTPRVAPNPPWIGGFMW